ncbi:helix-turn-helix transcriptional regulator [Dictyobacter arantiisoli]|uniref:WYL domain-containing protein n=1 Tax=Dictyobacter arantiisoli TaxID=2014874 RepID=A0A5A5TJ54_9CHLR|nr:WYL domain-containing transcriptional regulator [Dictyobacter arantiisoli]GCF11248.1 hypothetical protein KDI_48120 [Dictyobacter arantiisoli]
MKTDSFKKLERLLLIMKMFSVEKPEWRAKDIAARLDVNEDTVYEYLKELSHSGLLPLYPERHVWKLVEGAVIPRLTISLSYAEAGGLYLAGRLLAQIQDEQNWHISMALKKLVDALPPTLQEQQNELLRLLLFSDDDLPQAERQRDLSQIFQVLTSGWITRHRLRILYQSPKYGEFECFFDPYLLEPSAIGRTIYAIGFSSLAKDLRTFKLERIQKAELMNTSFAVPADFNGPALLRHAWGVMYGDEEPVKVRLRFHSTVTKRVRETRWHPTQVLQLTRDGCEWSAEIGDMTEIEPWIRGWGADCEVLEPIALRERVIQHVRRFMALYQIDQPGQPSAHNPRVFDRRLFRKEK